MSNELGGLRAVCVAGRAYAHYLWERFWRQGLECWESRARLAGRLLTSESRVQSWEEELHAAGLVAWRSHPGYRRVLSPTDAFRELLKTNDSGPACGWTRTRVDPPAGGVLDPPAGTPPHPYTGDPPTRRRVKSTSKHQSSTRVAPVVLDGGAVQVDRLFVVDDPPTKAVAVRQPRKSDLPPGVPSDWSRQLCDDWQTRTGGTAPGGQIGRFIRPLLNGSHNHPFHEVRAAWQRYLTDTEPQFFSPKRFADTYGTWSGEKPNALSAGQATHIAGLELSRELAAEEAAKNGSELRLGLPAAHRPAR